MSAVPSARLGMLCPNSRVPHYYPKYPGTLSRAVTGSQRSQHNVGVSLRRYTLFDLMPKTISGRREAERVSGKPSCVWSSISCVATLHINIKHS